MYTSTIGKTFLKEYNRREATNYTAKEFFDKVFYPLFFNHSKYLFWGQNSPFVQMKKGQKVHSLKPVERLEKLNEFHRKVEAGEKDASIAISYPASEIKEFATTSGLVTDLDIPVGEEEVYTSWIGGTLSLGVAGGYALLFDDPEITYATFKGWEVYRKYLSDPALEKLPGNKIITWNGQWLAYKFDKRFREDFDFNDFVNRKAIQKDGEKNTIEIQTIAWSKLFFSLSNKYPSSAKTAYVFAIGQTNKTIGFIPFQLKNGRRLHQIYQQLFGEDSFKTNQLDFESLFGKHIKRACELGNIGLQALEPKDLAKYFKDGSNLKLKRPSIKKKDKESEEDFGKRRNTALTKDRNNIITFQTYKTWLIAMISKNKTEISDYTRDIAAALVKFKDTGRKNDRKNLLEKDFFKTNKKDFLKALDTIVSDKTVEFEIVEKMNSLRDYIHFVNKEEFAYFILLLKFDFSYQERKSQEAA